jgi:hypothetical protein
MRLLLPTALEFFRRFTVSSRSYLPKIAVSVYALLFLFAIWSVIAASFPGSAMVASSVVEPQLAACGLAAGAAEGQRGPELQIKDRTSGPTGWMGAGMQDVYSCALLMGASYN